MPVIADVSLHVRPLVVVSGLPASGKSTAGRAVAEALSLPLFDKDEILEALFESLGGGDAEWRFRQSRAADHVLRALVGASSGGVVVSWWKHPRTTTRSGTETAWLLSLPEKIVELHCTCSPEVAVNRFFARQRHLGHLDAEKSASAELEKFRLLAALGPLEVGPLVVCNTELPTDGHAIARALREITG